VDPYKIISAAPHDSEGEGHEMAGGVAGWTAVEEKLDKLDTSIDRVSSCLLDTKGIQ
jgi:hypothetical protein